MPSIQPTDLRQLRRRISKMLALDAFNRPVPPVSVPGKLAPAPNPPQPKPPPMPRLGLGPQHLEQRKRLPPAPPSDKDGRGAYLHSELLRMDNRFRVRLERAFKRGKESRQAAANQIAAPRW